VANAASKPAKPRGRPPGSKNKPKEAVVAVKAAAKPIEPARPRGRPPGSKNQAKLHAAAQEPAPRGAASAPLPAKAKSMPSSPEPRDEQRAPKDVNLSSFIWSVADLLRGDFKQSEYGKVILPFTVLRRLDCVLEPTKAAVLTELATRSKRNPD